MKKYFIFLILIASIVIQTHNRQEKELSFSITNNHTAYPFSSFAKLVTGELHPGFEIGYRFNWKSKPRHGWFQAIKAGYFYHRFVQHAVPIYTQFGYRYKWREPVQLTAALGGGYMHSVPFTAVLELNDEDAYENGKGIGRSQAIVNVSLGAHYKINIKNDRPLKLSLFYQQQVQTPFVKSYVPLLPYNSLQFGFSLPLHHQ